MLSDASLNDMASVPVTGFFPILAISDHVGDDDDASDGFRK